MELRQTVLPLDVEEACFVRYGKISSNTYITVIICKVLCLGATKYLYELPNYVLMVYSTVNDLEEFLYAARNKNQRFYFMNTRAFGKC